MRNNTAKPMPELTGHQKEMFWSRVDMSAGPNACWLWVGWKNSSGYGRFNVWIDSQDIKLQAHRVSFFLANGRIDEKLTVDHLCHSRGCVNPAHLRLATDREQVSNLAGKQEGKFSSRFTGVYWQKRSSKWHARINIGDTRVHLGYFASETEAAAAYQSALSKLEERVSTCL